MNNEWPRLKLICIIEKPFGQIYSKLLFGYLLSNGHRRYMGFQILTLNRFSLSFNTPINPNLGQVLFQLRGDIDIPVLGQIADRLQQMTIFRSKIVWITATCLRRHDSKDNLAKTQPKHDSEIDKRITEKFPAILSG